MEKFNPQIPVRFGLIAFAFVLTTGMLMYVFYQAVISSFMLFAAIGLFSLAFVLFLSIWSGITYRRENGGVISFGHAFLAVFIVFFLNSVGSISSQLLVNKVIDKEYAEKASSLLKEKMTDYFDKNNVPEDKAKEAMKDMGPEKFNPPFSEMMKTLAKWLVAFAIISAIIAAFIKRGSGDLIESGMAPEPIKTI